MSEVTQADRDAAHEFQCYAVVGALNDVEMHELAEMFASHRQAAELRAAKAAIEAAVEVAEFYVCHNCGSLAGDDGCCEEPDWGDTSFHRLTDEIRDLDPATILKGERKPE